MQCTYALSRACCARFLLTPLLQNLDVIDARHHNHAKSNSTSLYVHVSTSATFCASHSGNRDLS
ncbi:unnamed protein product [Ixodes pacificus]